MAVLYQLSYVGLTASIVLWRGRVVTCRPSIYQPTKRDCDIAASMIEGIGEASLPPAGVWARSWAGLIVARGG